MTIRNVKYLNESDFDIKKCLAPQKPAENNEKLASEPEKNWVEKSIFHYFRQVFEELDVF